ncbi:hypothetical protein CPB85DRAFT_1293126 [Mucidula mucida]|nr:hypothetical protein CPB85DRAFT_1293126 [Mucidula mucida]
MYPVNSTPTTISVRLRLIELTRFYSTILQIAKLLSVAGTRSVTRRRPSEYRFKCLAPPLECELGSRIDYTWMCSPESKRVADLTDDETLSSLRRKRARVSEAEISRSRALRAPKSSPNHSQLARKNSASKRQKQLLLPVDLGRSVPRWLPFSGLRLPRKSMLERHSILFRLLSLFPSQLL